jgi:DNA modification methylase
MPEIDRIIIGDEPATIETGPLAPLPDAKPIVQVGDIFAMGAHRIICGDATDPAVFRILMTGTNPARLILTDEPHNIPVAGDETGGAHPEFLITGGAMADAEFRAFNTAWIASCLTHLRDGGVLATFIDWCSYPALVAAAVQLGLAPFDLIVWAKTNADAGSLYRSQYELLPLFKKGDTPHVNNVECRKNGRRRSNIWSYPGAYTLASEGRRRRQFHPTVMPVAMLEDAMRDMTERGDIVIDPFLASGSTLIACERTGRHCRGLELDPLYAEVILRRYEAVTKKPAVLESTGEIFAELAVRRQRDVSRT